MIRSRRKFWFGIGFLVTGIWLVLVMASWMSWDGHLYGAGSSQVRFGLIPWMTKTISWFRTGGATVTTYDVHLKGIAANIGLVVLIAVLLGLWWRHLVNIYVVLGGCDECGYPEFDENKRCPECGAEYQYRTPCKTSATSAAVPLVGMGFFFLWSNLSFVTRVLTDLGVFSLIIDYYKVIQLPVSIGISVIMVAVLIITERRHKRRLNAIVDKRRSQQGLGFKKPAETPLG